MSGGRWATAEASVRVKFFKRLQHFGILARMARPGAHVRKPELVQQARDRALVIVHPEPVADHLLEVDPAPPHNAIGLRIGAGLHHRRQLRLLARRQLRNRARWLAVVQALGPIRVEPMRPDAQALAVHAANRCRFGPPHPTVDRRDRQKT